MDSRPTTMYIHDRSIPPRPTFIPSLCTPPPATAPSYNPTTTTCQQSGIPFRQTIPCTRHARASRSVWHCALHAAETAAVDGGNSNASGRNGSGAGGGDDQHDPQPDPHHESIWSHILRVYMRLLHKRPLATKIVTAAVIGAISDLVAQCIEAYGARLFTWSFKFVNLTRVLALTAVGGVLTAPMFHFLYQLLEWYAPATNVLNTALQLAVDQLVAAPVWLVAFFALVSVFEGRFDVDELKEQIDRDFVASLKLVWTVFPAVQLINFTFVPINLRVLVLNVIDLAFTAVLSYIKHAPNQRTKASEAVS